MDEATRVLIVDDEALARERTRSLLAQVTGVELVGECSTGLQAVHAIEQHAPDINRTDPVWGPPGGGLEH